MMPFVYYTVAGIVLYVLADWLLNRIEQWRGGRIAYRSLVFFAIILTLTLAVFTLIEHVFS